MKNQLTVVLIFLSTIQLYAQNSNALPSIETITYNNQTINFQDTSIFTNLSKPRFQLGWHWDKPQHLNANQAFYVNTYHNHQNNGTQNFYNQFLQYGIYGTEQFDLVIQHSKLPEGVFNSSIAGLMQLYPLYARGFQLDPTANTTLNKQQPTRNGDTTGAVFGFAYRDSQFGHLNSTGENFNRYSLDSAGATQALKDTGIVVLSMNHFSKNFTSYDVGVNGSYGIDPRDNGNRWYCSINLRRTDTNDNSISSDTLLAIKFPFSYNQKIDTSWFHISDYDGLALDSISVIDASNPSNRVTLKHNLGLALKLQAAPLSIPPQTTWYITKSMLPRHGTTGTLPRDITLSCFFKTNTTKVLLDGVPFLPGGGGLETDKNIDSLDCVVRYYPKANVSIDWIRFETPKLRSLARGEEDTILWRCIKSTLETVQSAQAQGNNIRIKYIYGRDEPIYADNIMYMYSQRLYNTLLHNRLTTEGNTQGFVNDVVKMGGKWSGSMPNISGLLTHQPFAKYGWGGFPAADSVKSQGLKYGYMAVPNHSRLSPLPATMQLYAYETENSGFKSPLLENPRFTEQSLSDSTCFLYNYEKYLQNGSGASGPLNQVESIAYRIYNEELSSLYSEKPITTNVWTVTEGYFRGSTTPLSRFFTINYSAGIATGESVRIQCWSALVLGIKGLMTDRMYTLDDYTDTEPNTNKWLKKVNDNSSVGVQLGSMIWHKEQKESTLSGEAMINSPLFGDDFLYDNDPYFMAPFVDKAQVASFTRVAQNRIYLGFKSARKELWRSYNFCHTYSDTIMNLRLQAWFGKGYAQLRSGDSSLLASIIQYDTSKIKLRYPLRTKLANGVMQADYEDSDSTFYDITLHKDVRYSTNDVFYLGVLNRRTSPLLLDHDTVRFVSTFEFDSMCTVNPSLKYTQGGAREITIPFHKVNAQGQQFRVTELGGDFDTVVSNKANIIILFKPGEGKLLRFERVPTNQTIASGRLENTNQQKLVGYPIIRYEAGKRIETDSVHYHMVYHREENGNMNVYYRRSKPYHKGYTVGGELEWETERHLDSIIQLPNTSLDATRQCAFPAIVVREDSTQTVANERVGVYVTYAAEDRDIANRYHVVENMFNAQGFQFIDYAHIIDSAKGRRWFNGVQMSLIDFLGKWGAPTVNASAVGNYYAWADSSAGIVVRWKQPNAVYFQLSNYKDSLKFSSNSQEYIHPSFNTYSRMGLGERDCGIVWEERTTPEVPTSLIAYSRIFCNTNTNTVYHGLANNLDSVQRCTTNADSSIALLTLANDESNHVFPVLYRGVEDYATDTAAPYQERRLIQAHWDRAAWTTIFPLYLNPSLITMRALDIRDSSAFAPSHWWAHFPSYLFSNQLDVYSPVLSQGTMRSNGYTNICDSAFVLDCNTSTFQPPINSFPDNAMLTAYFGYWSVANNAYDVLNNPLSSRFKYHTNFEYNPHLAALPHVDTTTSYLANRRIFQASMYSDSIGSSVRYFGKRKATDAVRPLQLYGFTRDTSKSLVSSLFIGDKEYPFKSSATDERNPSALSDTLRTDWFSIGDVEELEQMVMGRINPCMQVYIERQGGFRTKTMIPLVSMYERQKTKNTIVVARGGNRKYRLVLTNTCPRTMRYFEAIEIDGIDVSTNKAKQSVDADRTLIDLSEEGSTTQLTVYPSPAGSSIQVFCDAAHRETNGTVTYKILNMMAQVVKETKVQTSYTTIDISEVPNGVYTIQCEYITRDFGKQTSSTMFVVSK